MATSQPHYLLFCDTHLSKSRACAITDHGFGRWHFVLERLDGPERLEAADSESEVHRDRLALLAVVRGLEALEQPSQVTLVTTSRYVSRGLRYGLNEWREADYTWEHFGIQRPIRNADLWQRIDAAMQFHAVTCRLLQSPLVQSIMETAEEWDEVSQIDTEPQSESTSSEVLDYPLVHHSLSRSANAAIERVDKPHSPLIKGPARRSTQQAVVTTIGVRDEPEFEQDNEQNQLAPSAVPNVIGSEFHPEAPGASVRLKQARYEDELLPWETESDSSLAPRQSIQIAAIGTLLPRIDLRRRIIRFTIPSSVVARWLCLNRWLRRWCWRLFGNARPHSQPGHNQFDSAGWSGA